MKLMSLFKKYGIFFILLLLILIFSTATRSFFTGDNFLNVLRQISMNAIVAVGITFVLLSGNLDLSVGSQISIVGVVVAFLMVKLQVPPVWAVLFGVLTGTGIGLINGVVMTGLKINSIIVTLAMQQVLKGISNILSGGMPISGLPQGFNKIGQGYLGVIPIPIIIMLVCALIGAFLLNKTYFGRYVYAVGGNEEAARLSGINVKRMKIMVFTICGFFTSIAGIIMLSRVNSGNPTTGIGSEMDILTATVLGGVSIQGGEGRVMGVLMGVLILGILNNGLVLLNVGDYYQNVIKGLLLVFAVGMDTLLKQQKKNQLPVPSEQ